MNEVAVELLFGFTDDDILWLTTQVYGFILLCILSFMLFRIAWKSRKN